MVVLGEVNCLWENVIQLTRSDLENKLLIRNLVHSNVFRTVLSITFNKIVL